MEKHKVGKKQRPPRIGEGVEFLTKWSEKTSLRRRHLNKGLEMRKQVM